VLFMSTRSGRTLRRTATLAIVVALASGGIAQAEPTEDSDVTLRLPAPTGPHRIGATTLHLVDHARRDPWDNSVRELMTTVFYPARDVRGYPVAPQMSRAAAEAFERIDVVWMHPELPKEGVDWAATMTHSHTDAPAQAGRRPVLLYSPGGADPRTIGTGVAEEMASRGYVVVTIDHPGETSAVEFPDGRLREIGIPGDPRTDPQLARTMMTTRFADTRFVLDQLEVLAAGGNPDADGRTLPANLGRALDLRRMGMYGHSAGGGTAAESMYEDRRIDAAVNLEGYLDHLPEEPGQAGELFQIAQHGVDRPLLLVGTDGFRDERFERSWSAMLAHRGCTRWRQLDDATHWVFTDFGAIAPQLQTAELMSAEDRAKLVGAIDPGRSVPAVRSYVRSFFARHVPV
jgi:dienelactone hydrolase